jgi:hypothetical protein
MTMPQTESSDMKVWERQEWRLRSPLNFPVLVVDAPEVFTGLRSREPQEAVPGDFVFVGSTREGNIDTLTHQSLLEESVREYSDIWRTLAEK